MKRGVRERSKHWQACIGKTVEMTSLNPDLRRASTRAYTTFPGTASLPRIVATLLPNYGVLKLSIPKLDFFHNIMDARVQGNPNVKEPLGVHLLTIRRCQCLTSLCLKGYVSGVYNLTKFPRLRDLNPHRIPNHATLSYLHFQCHHAHQHRARHR